MKQTVTGPHVMDLVRQMVDLADCMVKMAVAVVVENGDVLVEKVEVDKGILHVNLLKEGLSPMSCGERLSEFVQQELEVDGVSL